MPQFDKITFFTQIFWLTIIFFGFYFLTLKIFLPKIATVLKTRRKKFLIGSSGLLNLNKEQNRTESSRNSLIQEFSEYKKDQISIEITGFLGLFSNNKFLLSLKSFPHNCFDIELYINTLSLYLETISNLESKSQM
tara:strand:+ start:223 stop:630 length:408 start_codon:yes stop_codon:yes gene_type:complete